MSGLPERLTTALADRYRLERELGQGGMATVYLAEDLKHRRKVAIKVLKPELAAVLGAERFVQEITTTAALQHPHILPLFDSGTADGFLYYVMPYIQGETLRSKLDRETQLGIEESVRIASDVASALHYAHQHGVIHRDIKPENILLHDGRPMVADFGIALAVSAAAGGRMTETGLSLGTPHYMSPEQATAEKEISARSDVYSLGSVLYEMLTGSPPHVGASAQQIIMKIVTEEAAPVTKLRKAVPGNVAAAVATALEKLPADRFGSAGAFAAALGDSHFRGSATASHAAVHSRGRSMPVGVAVGLVALALVASAAGWIGRGWSLRPAPSASIQFATTLGTPGVDQPRVAISADGHRIVQAVTDSTGVARLAVRDLTRNTVTPILGTEQASGGEFSPQGDWIAFEADDQLRKISVDGGPAITLVSSMTVDGPGIAWTPSGDIVFSGRGTGLWRVAAGGGTPVQLTQIDTTRKEFGHWHPRMLPGGRTMIYTNYATPIARARIEAYEFTTGRTTILAEGAVHARYAPTGHLLFARDGAVFTVAFDPERLEVRGTPVPVQNDVVWEATNGLAGYDISANGTFIYLQASEWDRDRTIVWRDRAGRDVPLIDRPGAFLEPRLSPDGQWIAFTLAKPKLELWLYNIGRRTMAQLTRAPAAAFNAVWMQDSRRVVYTHEDRAYDLHVIPIDASGPDRSLVTSAYDKFAQSIAPDGRVMLMMENPGRDRLMLVSLDSGGGPPRPMAESAEEQRLGVFSPDGRWIAYAEHGARGSDIYLRAVTGSGGRRLVSDGGGSEPRWTRDGRELVYLGSAAMMSVTVNPLTGEAGTPVPLFSIGDLERAPWGRAHSYDVTPDGSRFLVAKPVGRPAAQPLVVVLNWRPDAGRPAGSSP